MTEDELMEIEVVMGGDDEPETDWWVTTTKALIAEVPNFF